ncbi:MAG TPA: lytic transglycosylase domain-containing protein [Caulobacteraceae bacterium]|nr:lytic transglycosylase domain-containing protein [Caulobacteraceae bacterium]
MPVRRAAGFLAVFVCAASALGPAPGRAQVLEIGDDGVVTVYDRPTVFTSEGATPIVTPGPRPLAGVRIDALDRRVIGEAAKAAELSPALVAAVAWRESRMTPGVVSRAGAIGEMQLMPATARQLGVDPHDTRQNYGGGAAYLRVLLNRYDGDLIRTLAAYNAGPGAVDRYGGVPPFRETRAYVTAIMDRLSQQASIVDANGSGR